MIHRIIKEFLHGKIDEARAKKLVGIVDYASVQSSDMERVAQAAEREVDDLKKAEYMSSKIGEKYTGIISSVTNFGIFIELPNTIEGLVHISDLNDDYYVYDEKHLCLVGERRKKVYRLGDEVFIEVVRVDMESHEIYFQIAKEEEEEEKEEVTIESLGIENEVIRGELKKLEENDEKLSSKNGKVEAIHSRRERKTTKHSYKSETIE